MANSTATYWEADGQSLQTYARNIETMGGRMAPPPLKGVDIDIPGVIGEKYIPKVAGSRILTLKMWVRATDADGNYPSSRAALEELMDKNWYELVNLLWTPGRQFALKKRFRYNGEIRSATALAEFSGGFEPTMIGRNAGKFTVDLKLADPYFYDDIVISTPLVNGNQNVTVLGNADTNRIKFELNGARTAAAIRNNTLDLELKYNDALLTGDVTEIDIRRFRSFTTPDGETGFTTNTKIIHSGAQQWFLLKPGVNQINAAAGIGTGSRTMTHQAAWL